MSPQGPRIRVHATAIALGAAARAFGAPEDTGVLLLGPSGSGKSDVALRLIANGARLVSDDQTELWCENGRLWADAPETIRGLLEIHDVGVVRLEGAGKTILVLAVMLDPKAAVRRMPEPESYVPPGLFPPLSLPLMTLRPFEAATPAKIAAGASALVLGRFVAGVAPAK